jgi:replicative DNA helicase
LWIIGGYTNLGKTYASLNILTHLLKQGKRTVFYSLEMSRVDIISRILGILTGENGSSIAKGYVEKTKVETALETIRTSNLGIHSSKTELSQILLSMYEESIKNKPELFVVDFLQLITVKGTSSEYEAVTHAILELQKASKRFKIPIIVLSQVSNDGARQGDQQVMGFKGSGAIASSADLAIELVSGEESVKELREKMNNGEPVKIKWHIKKNRHGRVGSMNMEFTGKTGIFTEENDNF